MNIYNEIGKKYREHRSPEIGVSDIKEFINKASARSVLDLGCGNGFPIATSLRQEVDEYVGVDSSEILLAEFKENVPNAKSVHSKLELLDLGNSLFDLVFSYGVIFHLRPQDQLTALTNAVSFIAPGGLLVFNSGSDPGSGTGNVAGYDIDHWSIGDKKYVEHLEGLGLKYLGNKMGEGQNLFFIFSRDF